MGITPVPTTVDDSHINQEALALQVSIIKNIIINQKKIVSID